MDCDPEFAENVAIHPGQRSFRIFTTTPSTVHASGIVTQGSWGHETGHYNRQESFRSGAISVLRLGQPIAVKNGVLKPGQHALKECHTGSPGGLGSWLQCHYLNGVP